MPKGNPYKMQRGYSRRSNKQELSQQKNFAKEEPPDTMIELAALGGDTLNLKEYPDFETYTFFIATHPPKCNKGSQ